MFARSVSFQLKPGHAAAFTQLLDKDIIPVLRKQKGFQDEIAFVTPGGTDAVGISVWDLKENAETYARGAYSAVLKALEQVVEGTPRVLRAELPDMKEEEIDLTLEDNTLTLRGERKLDAEVAEEQFHRIERSYGAFARTFALPPTVDAGKVSAEYKAGVLTIRLPLREEAKPKQIKVQIAA